MISRVLYAFEAGVGYVKRHPQILFALLLIIVLPIAFLYSGNQFLEAGQSSQNRLQKERIGLLHDVFVSMLQVSNFDSEIIDIEISAVAALNPDITKFRVAKYENGEIIPIAALDDSVIEVPEVAVEGYQSAAVRTDTSISYVNYYFDERRWKTYRSVTNQEGEIYFIFTENSLAAIDNLLLEKKRSAYASLGLIYVFVLLIAFWHIRVTDYRYLYKQAQQAIATKDMFMNMIAHELRAPLTAIRGYASLMTESEHLNNDDKVSASRIQNSSERLITIVNDLLDVARIQSGKLKIESSSVDIVSIVRDVVTELQPLAASKKIAIKQSGANALQDVWIDKKRAHQALTNLVSNAIKYTNEGTIDLYLEDKRNEIEIRVKDTGVGISAEDQQKLFAPFFRVENESTGTITGTGLGMWITRQLIELMGAKIGVESIKGVGTHIVVHIPKKGSKST